VRSPPKATRTGGTKHNTTFESGQLLWYTGSRGSVKHEPTVFGPTYEDLDVRDGLGVESCTVARKSTHILVTIATVSGSHIRRVLSCTVMGGKLSPVNFVPMGSDLLADVT
jgi:hypothetical protein